MFEQNHPYNMSQNSYKPYPTRVISNQDILELNGEQQTLIGKTMDYVTQLENTCQQAIQTAEKHYNRLVELGDIVPPKSTEELLQEQITQQQEMNNELLRITKQLSEKISKLEGEQNGFDKNSTTGSEVVFPRTGKSGKRKNETVPAD